MFKKTIISLVLGLSLVAAAPATAGCFADYKAKQEDPLRLHYGVMKVADSACSNGRAASIVKQRLAARGWKLLKVLSTFDDSGLASRKAKAGANYLKY